MSTSLGELLAAPFEHSDIEWRLQWNDDEKGSGLAVPYVTNRAIQNRLDKVLGVGGWRNEYIPWHNDGKKSSQICGISIYFEERREWITKHDGAEDSDIEPVKGGLSDSMKRAAVQWGIGRYLYSAETVFVQTEKRGKTSCIKRSEQAKLDAAHQALVAKMFGKAEVTKPEKPAPVSPSAPAPKAEAPGPKAVPTPDAPADTSCIAKGPTAYYQVKKVAKHPTMKGGSNTNLQLLRPDGGIVQVYLQGENPALVPEVWLMDIEISQTTKNGVLFNILESFRVYQEDAA